MIIPLRAEQEREVANLTERKNQHTPVYGVKEFVCLSVCLSVFLSVCLSVYDVSKKVPLYILISNTPFRQKFDQVFF